MQGLIVSITRVKPTSTMASSRIALWLSQQLKLPLVSRREEIAQALQQQTRQLRNLIIVNGPIVFCNFDDLLEEAILRTQRLVYVQNDYAIEVLKRTGNPQQKNRMRAAMNRFKGELSYWTTVESTLARSPQNSTLVNWNALTWRLPRILDSRPALKDKRCLYYGAFRRARLPSFDAYFRAAPGSFYLSTTKAGAKQFSSSYPGLEIGDAVPDVIEAFSGRFRAGLLIADRLSNKVYHSPPNRWYEMLSMNIPVLVDDACRPTLERAGYGVDESDSVGTGAEVSELLFNPRRLKQIYDRQALWRKHDPRPKLRRELRDAVTRSGLC